jgi:hypothetical protein
MRQHGLKCWQASLTIQTQMPTLEIYLSSFAHSRIGFLAYRKRIENSTGFLEDCHI